MRFNCREENSLRKKYPFATTMFGTQHLFTFLIAAIALNLVPGQVLSQYSASAPAACSGPDRV